MLDVADRAKANGWSLAALDLGLDTSTDTGRFTLQVLAAVSELERAQISTRTKQALAAARSRGVRLGRPRKQTTDAAGRRAAELRAEGMVWQTIADTLAREGVRTGTGGKWWPANLRLAALPFLTREAAHESNLNDRGAQKP